MLKAVILLMLAILQVKLIHTGDILYFLAPTMLPFFYFSTLSFLVMAAYRALVIIAESESSHACSDGCGCADGQGSTLGRFFMYSLFTLLLILGFFMPVKLLDSSLVDKKGIIYHQVAPRAERSETRQQDFDRTPEIDHEWWDEYEFEPDQPKEQLPGEQEILKDELGIWYDESYYLELADRLLAMDTIVVDDRGFLDIMLVIAAYQDRFQNRKIELSGFVYRDGAMSENELAVTRTAITCCLADATFYGILVRGEGMLQFENDSWVRVTGLIDQDYIFNQNMLMISAIDAEQIPPPDSPYVYPYLYRQYMP